MVGVERPQTRFVIVCPRSPLFLLAMPVLSLTLAVSLGFAEVVPSLSQFALQLLDLLLKRGGQSFRLRPPAAFLGQFHVTQGQLVAERRPSGLSSATAVTHHCCDRNPITVDSQQVPSPSRLGHSKIPKIPQQQYADIINPLMQGRFRIHPQRLVLHRSVFSTIH